MRALRLPVLLFIAASSVGALAEGKFTHRPADEVMLESEALVRQLTEFGTRLLGEGLELSGLLNPLPTAADRGQKNNGVYRASHWQDGRTTVLKLSDTEVFSFPNQGGGFTDFSGRLWSEQLQDPTSLRFREYVLAHKLLGDIGVAPQLIAILDYGNTLALMQTLAPEARAMATKGDFEFSLGGGRRFVGLLMEEVAGAYNLARSAPPPLFLNSWSEASLIRTLEQIVEIRRRLLVSGIVPQDQQLAVNRSGDAFLIDIDGAYFDHKKAMKLSFDAEIRKLVGDWSEVHGIKFNRAILDRILREARDSTRLCTGVLERSWRTPMPFKKAR